LKRALPRVNANNNNLLSIKESHGEDLKDIAADFLEDSRP